VQPVLLEFVSIFVEQDLNYQRDQISTFAKRAPVQRDEDRDHSSENTRQEPSHHAPSLALVAAAAIWLAIELDIALNSACKISKTDFKFCMQCASVSPQAQNFKNTASPSFPILVK
jgi:predicted nucleic acid binding AN1-type Zn finger protein